MRGRTRGEIVRKLQGMVEEHMGEGKQGKVSRTRGEIESCIVLLRNV